MVRVSVVTVLVLACLLGASSARSPTGNFRNVLATLSEFASPDDHGFRLQTQSPKSTIDATSHAIRLASLNGVRHTIDLDGALGYIETLRQGDHGYGRSAGLASDVASVRDAVLAYVHAGKPVPSSSNVVAFLKSLYDSSAKLFAGRIGEKADLVSTAAAFQTLDLLAELDGNAWAKDAATAVKATLAAADKGTHFAFPNEKALAPVSANYYALQLAGFVGHKVADTDKRVQWIVEQQHDAPEDRYRHGGVYSDKDKTMVSVAATSHAVLSLSALSADAVEKLNLDSLSWFLSGIAPDLSVAGDAHAAIAATPLFSQGFQPRASYESEDGRPLRSTIVQGTQVKPMFALHFDALSHAGLTVEVSATYPDGTSKQSAMTWKDSLEKYVSDELFPTTGVLGEVSFAYKARAHPRGASEMSFDTTDARMVGYGITVDAKANLAGRDIHAGESVGLGTSFNFGVTLFKHDEADLLSGDFDVIFSVIDSSNVVLSTSKTSGRGNTAPFAFAYELSKADVPPGTLTFRVEVANAAGAHTRSDHAYRLSMPAIASAITFSGTPKAYKINDDVTVSMEPASLPDMRTLHVYQAKVNGADARSKRRFVMDVVTPSGTVLRTVDGQGTASGDNSRYVFKLSIDSSLDSIGTSNVAFRYITAQGQSVALDNYDSETGELMDDTTMPEFRVAADLTMTDITAEPKAGEVTYGSEVSFAFKLKDGKSGAFVHQGKHSAGVYMTLEHEEAGRQYQSAREQAKQDGDVFKLTWAVSANAVRGKGTIKLEAQDADGRAVVIKRPGGTASYDVVVGGAIDVQHEAWSTVVAETNKAVFVVEFELFCKKQKIKNAELSALVMHKNKDQGYDFVRGPIDVAISDNGAYQVSWGSRSKDTPAGEYQLLFMRAIDRERAAQAKGKTEEELDYVNDVEHMFKVILEHEGAPGFLASIRGESYLLLGFGVLFYVLHGIKTSSLELKRA